MVKTIGRIECGWCSKTKGCIQTFDEPKEDGTTSHIKFCLGCTDSGSGCVPIIPSKTDGNSHGKCNCR